MSTLPKLELNLNEENEINFSISFEGTVSETEMSAPVFRLVMTEMNSENGWIFNGKKESENIISVKIPPLKEGFSSGKKYHGKLEAIMGPLYFAPTEIMIEFKQPIKIEAIAIIKQDKKLTTNTVKGMVMDKSLLEKDKDVSSKKEELIIEEENEELLEIENIIKDVDNKKNQQTKLTKEEQEIFNEMLETIREKRQEKSVIQNKIITNSPPPKKEISTNSGTEKKENIAESKTNISDEEKEKMKSKFKSLILDALTKKS